jgi:thiamine kinase
MAHTDIRTGEFIPRRMLGWACRLADLQGRIHAIPGPPGIPAQHERLQDKVDQAKGLPRDLRQAALRGLNRMPEGDRLCHGDFHPGNIVLTKRGPIVLDWIDAIAGNPSADVARTSVLVEGGCAVDTSLSRLQRVMVRLAHRTYLNRYLRGRPGKEAEYMRWRPIIAAARMSEGIEELQDWLGRFVQAELRPRLKAA